MLLAAPLHEIVCMALPSGPVICLDDAQPAAPSAKANIARSGIKVFFICLK